MKQMLLILSITVIVFSINIQEIEGLRGNEEYVILSDESFIVMELDIDKKITIIDGGVFYNEKWQIFDTFSITVNQHSLGNIGSIIGNLESKEQFGLTWNAIMGHKVITKAWIFDGEIRTEVIDENGHITRLFF